MPQVRQLPPEPKYDDLPNWDVSNWDTMYRRLANFTWQLLLTRDPGDFTLREIAHTVGVSPPTIYTHFRDKNALLAVMAELSIGKLTGELADVVEGADPETHIRSLCLTLLRFAEKRPRHFALIFAIQWNDEETYPEIAKRRNQLRLFIAGLAHQRLGFVPTKAEANAFWAMIHGAAALVAAGEPRQPVDALLEAIDAYLAVLKKKKRD